MQARVHPEYTFLSFTIWHDRPLTAEKMDSIAASSAHVVDMSRELTAYAAIYKDQGWSSDDVKFLRKSACSFPVWLRNWATRRKSTTLLK
jgi:hypothetical protein